MQSTPKQIVRNAVSAIQPYDDLEKSHIDNVLSWIDSDAQLFRISKPDNPPKHLVSYFVLYDESKRSIMLIDHVKAELWLPTGGHVDPDEDPHETVTREAYEELKIKAEFNTVFGDNPLFITVTETVGSNTHTDVSLWYVIRGEANVPLDFDTREIKSCKWLTLDEVLATDITELDPHMHRFVQKMKQSL